MYAIRSYYATEYDKLRANPSLIPNMVNEIIRWQTPLAHMRRTATRDTLLAGKQIKQGDKVVLWYVSANRDETVIERANEFVITSYSIHYTKLYEALRDAGRKQNREGSRGKLRVSR